MFVRLVGGVLGIYVYYNLKDLVVVEFIKVDVGMDIGDIFIGMYLKYVVVLVCINVKEIGSVYVMMVKICGKLIGGVCVVYVVVEEIIICC